MRRLLLYIFILFVCSVSAEQFMITGKVVDADNNEPFFGASVVDVGSRRGVVTDFDGNFSIDVEKGAILKFSYLGYYDKLVEFLNDSSLVVEMKERKEICYCSEYARHIILPDNHLKRSLKEIKSLYPHLKKCKGNIYESKHSNEIFSLYNGIVYKQSYSFKHYTLNLPGNSNALERVYYSFVNSFKGYDSSEECQSGKGKIFYYPEYSVYIQYEPNERVSVTYELKPEYYK